MTHAPGTHRRRRPVLTVIAAVASSSLLSGCLVAIPLSARDDAQGTGSPSGPTIVASPGATEVLSYDIGPALSETMRAQAGVRVEAAGDGPSTYVGDVDLTGGTDKPGTSNRSRGVDWDVVETFEGDKYLSRRVDGVVYLKGASESAEWGKVDEKTPPDVYDYAAWLDTNFDVPEAVAYAIAGERFKVTTSGASTTYTPILPGNFLVELTVGSSGLPASMTVKFDDGDKMTFRYTKWNVPVSIVKPTDVGPIDE